MVETSQLAGALQCALNRNEISAWFQPQIDLQTNRLVAAEALCRWQHTTWGAVRPDEFIPVAEDTGAIGEIGRFMTAQALAAIAEWGIEVSVNVSPVQLEDAEFTTWLQERIDRIRPAERRLTVEITEGRHLDDVPPLVARLDRLRSLGVGIAIDDFGSGHASLTQARRLHATELKIDRSLVADDSPTTVRTLADAVSAAHDADLRVVAEGVETSAQLGRVARLGCDRAQGYLLGRPVPRAEMARLVAAA